MTVAEDRHPFEEGDMVTFSDVRGMVELNGCAPRAVHVLGPQQFTIGDTSSFSPYESFGWCTQVKQPKTLRFAALRDANRRPADLVFTDYGKMDHAIALHTAVIALDRFLAKFGHVPRPWNEEDAGIFVQLANEVGQSFDAEFRPAGLNEEVLKTFAMTCCGELCPITAAFGGIAGQEVLKACSGKFAPIRQFLYYDAFEALPPRGDHGRDFRGDSAQRTAMRSGVGTTVKSWYSGKPCRNRSQNRGYFWWAPERSAAKCSKTWR